ncbi:diaminopimelate epimerase [Pontimicrobium sp. IMCC45349]|uniref:diaminopimelate epimerase n=1 Tax=Pontimicrobium sp. IMCC45349 TaxID=3391574 RepID=UPI0039A16FD0
MKYTFYKYQGTGNDFVMIDNRDEHFDKTNTKLVAQFCDRRFGIGADGLILLENDADVDFKMVYYNADGNESSMCGNGGRCLVAFAKQLGVIANQATFMAIDGLHHAVIENGIVELQMQDVTDVKINKDYVFLDTGSPHYVQFKEGLTSLEVKEEGAKIRYNDVFKENGTNVNFVQKDSDSQFSVRTYERGVEDETLSCGTGVTAVALAMHYIGETEKNNVALQTQGGLLNVKFVKTDDVYKDVWLIGPATFVFKGEIEW